MKRVTRFGWVLVALLSSFDVSANVSLRNGNFFIGYTDILYPGGFEPKIERVYNSKTPYKGIFGWGWGTEYEAYLRVSADGSVVIYEYGGGAENRFSPRQFNKKELSEAVEKIVGVAKAAGILGTAKSLQEYRKKLTKDAVFRNDEWEKFRAQGKLKARTLKNKTQLYSNRFSYQYVTKVKSGYVRTYDNGKLEWFSNQGRLIKVTDRNGNFVQLNYGKNGQLSTLKDNFNRRMSFKFNARGLLAEVTGENGKKSKYRYNGRDELIWSRDVDGNVYRFAYSSDNRHNMTEIKYSDKTNLKISYYPRSKNENVSSVKERDGTWSFYSYWQNKKMPGNFKVSVQVKDKDKKTLISKSSYEYFMKRKASGEEWTQRMITSLDGQVTDTTYNECCGLPVVISRNGRKTTFDYDRKGRVVRKETPTEVTQLKYHNQLGKVVRVDSFSKRTKRKKWSSFKYDKKANLVFAKNSDKKGVKLFYDRKGRIKSMLDQSKRRIDFTYDENSKPIVIKDPKLGSIKVSYTSTGEVKQVESSAGRRIAMQVTTAFQNLLEIIRPAGVTLAF